MNIVVVGAGPTGVEVCGALAEMRNNVFTKGLSDLDFKKCIFTSSKEAQKRLGQ